MKKVMCPTNAVSPYILLNATDKIKQAKKLESSMARI